MLATTPSTESSTPNVTLADLRAIVADLHRVHPEAGARVEHGAYLALFGRCESDTGTSWWVGSERDAHREYLVMPQHGTCTCQDHQRHGHLSPCKHRLCVEIFRRLERAEAEATDPTLAPIAYLLTPTAIAALDDFRQRDAARCPTCNDWKQHGSLYCGGERCEQARPALRLVVARGEERGRA
jgi:hypothetical protein